MTERKIEFSDPVTERAFSVIKQVGCELKQFLFNLSLNRVAGSVTASTSLHNIREPRSIILRDADIKIHRAIVKAFEKKPVTIIAEEGLVIKKGAIYRILLDDLDGTYNASRGVLGRSAISLAIDKNKKPLTGMWHNPYFEEIVVREIAGEVWYSLSGNVVKVDTIPSPKELSKARIITGSTGTTNNPRSKLINPPLSRLISQILAPLNFESSVVSLMDVALGRAEGFVIAGNKAWDLWAARTIFPKIGIPFAFFTECWSQKLTEKEVNDFDPKNHLFGFICAANKNLFDSIVEILTK